MPIWGLPMSQWFVRLRNKVSGPYTTEQLRAMRRVGGLSRLHEISTDRENWEPATTFADLFQEKELVLPAKRSSDGSSSSVALPVSSMPPTFGADESPSTASKSGLPAPPMPPRDDTPRWYYAKGTERTGPITLRELQKLVADGAVEQKDLVWHDGLSSWIPSARATELLPSLSTSQTSLVEGSPVAKGKSLTEHDWREQRNALFDPKVWATVLPAGAWLRDRPWSVRWVQMFLFFGLFPLGLLHIYRDQESLVQTAGWYSLYFALVWTIILRFCMRPQPVPGTLTAKVIGFTIVPGLFIATALSVLAVQIPLIEEGMTAPSAMPARLLAWTVGVGIPEEATKFLAVFLFVRAWLPKCNATTCAFVGCVGGLTFGAAEAAVYSLMYAIGASSELFSSLGLDFSRVYGGYINIQLTRFITLPLLHAVWTGVTAYFLGLSALSPATRGTLVLIGIIISSVLHGFYDALSEGWWGFAVAAVSLLLFVSYIRMDEIISREVSRGLETPNAALQPLRGTADPDRH